MLDTLYVFIKKIFFGRAQVKEGQGEREKEKENPNKVLYSAWKPNTGLDFKNKIS